MTGESVLNGFPSQLLKEHKYSLSSVELASELEKLQKSCGVMRREPYFIFLMKFTGLGDEKEPFYKCLKLLKAEVRLERGSKRTHVCISCIRSEVTVFSPIYFLFGITQQPVNLLLQEAYDITENAKCRDTDQNN